MPDLRGRSRRGSILATKHVCARVSAGYGTAVAVFVSCTGFLSEIGTKLRDLAILQAGLAAYLRQHCPQITQTPGTGINFMGRSGFCEYEEK